MTNQVTSIEQSKRLLELGVPAEKANMVWVPDYKFNDRTRQFIPTGDYQLTPKHRVYDVIEEKVISAFTVADLIQIMPPDIPAVGEQNNDYALTLSNSFCWNLRYENNHTHRYIGEKLEFDLVDLLCDRIEWLVSNGYKLAV